jgi:hypothetical protein
MIFAKHPEFGKWPRRPPGKPPTRLQLGRNVIETQRIPAREIHNGRR